MPVCLSRVKVARVKNYWQEQFIRPARVMKSLLLPLIAAQCQKLCWNLNCLATPKAHSLELLKIIRVSFKVPTAARYFWTKLAICHCPCKSSCYVHCKSG